MDKLKFIIRSAFAILFLVLIVILSLNTKSDYVDFADDVSVDIVKADGTTAHYDSNIFELVDKGDKVTITIELPETKRINDGVLCFRVYHSVVTAYYDGAMIYSFGSAIDNQGKMIGAVYPEINIPNRAWGKSITIVLDVRENDAFSKINDFKVYQKEEAYKYVLSNNPSGFVVAVSMMFISAIAILILFAYGKNTTGVKKGYCLAFLSIFISLWMFTSSGYYNLVEYSYLWVWMEYLSIFIAPLPMCLYMYFDEENKKRKKIFAGSAIAESVFVLASIILNITNQAHYCVTLVGAHIFIMLYAAGILVYTIIHIKEKPKSSLMMVVGMVSIVFFAMLDIARFNVNKYFEPLYKHTIPSVLPIGVLLFIVFLLMSYYQDIHLDKVNADLLVNNVNKLEDALSSIPAGICVIRFDKSLTIIEANSFFYEIFGYTSEEAAKFGFNRVDFPIDSEDREKVIKDGMDAIDSGNLYYETELTANHRNGKRISISVRSYMDLLKGFITLSVMDVTKRNEITEKLRISEESYKLALAQSGQIFFSFDVTLSTIYLPPEIAAKLRLPYVMHNVPESMISDGFVAQESIDAYRNFFKKIYAGVPGDSVYVNLRTGGSTIKYCWNKVTYTSIFDDLGRPSSALIVYEDLSEQRNKEISGAWKQQNILSTPKTDYFILENDFTQNKVLDKKGELFDFGENIPDNFDEALNCVVNTYIATDDKNDFMQYINREMLIDKFEKGKSVEGAFECHINKPDAVNKWIQVTVQMITDSYSKDVLAQILFKDINAEKTGQIEIKRNMDELEKELEQSRIKIMINQMQPHFLYNALTAIRVITKTDPDYAYDLLYDFATHLRGSISALSSDKPITFADEMKNVKAYLNIEKMRFGERLKVVYEIECDQFLVLPLSIQPIAENAARHGIYERGKAGGTVTIKSYETDKYFIVEVSDDGVGFDVDEVLNADRDSVGLKNLIFRIKSLMSANVVINSVIDKGTKVTVYFPKSNNDSIEE